MHVTGKWSASKNQFEVVAKFGFQQLRNLDAEGTGGCIFGNITSSNDTAIGEAVLMAVPQMHISKFYSDSMYGQTCDSMLNRITDLIANDRCFPNGTDVLLRSVPCTKGKLCEGQKKLKKMIRGFQMMLRIERQENPQYWYVVLVGCSLNKNCTWVPLQKSIDINYDLWLTNGNPLSRNMDLFAYQFSFDEQDTILIYFVALFMYLTLSIFEWRAVISHKQIHFSSRQKLLCLILVTKIVGLALQLLNMIVFAYDGRGLILARLLGEFFRLLAICIMYLLLILLSRGWSINDSNRSALNRMIIFLWIFLVIAHFFFFFANFFFVDDILHDIDIFKSWPGYGMLLVRLCQALWFLAEIRYTISRERDEEKAVFLAYFGAGFLVWFVYLSALGVIVSFISVLWRFKIILAITTFANFVAISSLVHLFWPTGSYSRFFAVGNSCHRRLDSVNSAELRDMEYLLQDSDSDSDNLVLDLRSI